MPPKLQRQTAKILTGPDNRPEIGETNGLHGLSADFPHLIEIDLDRIQTNPDQPRTVFDEEGLRSLARSIDEHGLQQPILVKEETKGHYRLVAGERRLRAHRLLGRPTIFAIVTRGDADEVALIENLQRVDLDAVDLARAIERMVERLGYTREAIGTLIGVDRAEVSRRLAVLRLPEDILTEYRQHSDAISRSLLVEIATVEDGELQRVLWNRACNGWTVRAVRDEKKARAKSTPDRSGTALRAIGQGLLRIDTELERMEKHRGALVSEHVEKLREARQRIDDLLDGWD
jgi:ParB family transcriptional regulator, chromosome partitioning protein